MDSHPNARSAPKTRGNHSRAAKTVSSVQRTQKLRKQGLQQSQRARVRPAGKAPTVISPLAVTRTRARTADTVPLLVLPPRAHARQVFPGFTVRLTSASPSTAPTAASVRLIRPAKLPAVATEATVEPPVLLVRAQQVRLETQASANHVPRAHGKQRWALGSAPYAQLNMPLRLLSARMTRQRAYVSLAGKGGTATRQLAAITSRARMVGSVQPLPTSIIAIVVKRTLSLVMNVRQTLVKATHVLATVFVIV